MNWESRNGRPHLYSRKARIVTSHGPFARDGEDLRCLRRRQEKQRGPVEALTAGSERQAAVLCMLGAGRLPVSAVRTLRALEAHGKRTGICTVGTNALHAYETMSGVAFNFSSATTGHVGSMVDDPNRLKPLTHRRGRLNRASPDISPILAGMGSLSA
ncbi:MAG: hypothetical protein F4145_08140, partial [Boseongicola sp. SB0675_bin_26]|nr:hypothetical protein [Boseongicola sp. SB0675_bin_26]